MDVYDYVCPNSCTFYIVFEHLLLGYRMVGKV